MRQRKIKKKINRNDGNSDDQDDQGFKMVTILVEDVDKFNFQLMIFKKI